MGKPIHISCLAVSWKAPPGLPDWFQQDPETQKWTRKLGLKINSFRALEYMVSHMLAEAKFCLNPEVERIWMHTCVEVPPKEPHRDEVARALVVEVPLDRTTFLALPETNEVLGDFQCRTLVSAACLLERNYGKIPAHLLRDAAAEFRNAQYQYAFLVKRNKIARYGCVAAIEQVMGPVSWTYNFLVYRKNGSVFRKKLWAKGDPGNPPRISRKLPGIQFVIRDGSFRLDDPWPVLGPSYEFSLAEVLEG